MKKINLFFAAAFCLFSLSTYAQTKSAAQVVTELCTASSYSTSPGSYISVQVVLAGHGAFCDAGFPSTMFGHGSVLMTKNSIKDVRVSNFNTLTYKVVDAVAGPNTAANPGWRYIGGPVPNPSSKYAGCSLLVTLTNGMTTTSTTVGSVKITYGDNTNKIINLPSNMTVRGTSLNTGYTMTGVVTGEFGQEQIILIIKSGNLPG